MKKAAGIAVALFFGWFILKSCAADPQGSAQKVNDAANSASQAGGSAGVFIASLSGGALLGLGIIALAIWLSKR